MKSRSISPAIAALAGAALALPVYQKVVQAKTPLNSPKLNFQYSRYDEDRLDSSNFADILGGERDRYEIDVIQGSLVYPISDKFQLTANAAWEKMSGASPWFITESSSGEPLQVMSGATIDDQRTDVSFGLDMFFDRYTITPTLGISKEKDYLAVFGSLSTEYELANKATTLRGGVSVSMDTVEPTEDLINDPGRVDKEDKDSYNIFAGISQVINKNTVIQSTLTLGMQDGFLSDPYKLVEVASVVRRDTRPDDRTQYIWTLQLRRWSEWFAAALHADYRFYYDDWDVRAHTLDLGMIKRSTGGWSFEYSIRYYSQTQAEFYEPFFAVAPADGFQSSDYRLSPYGAFSFRVKIAETVKDWTISLAAERYISDKSYSIQKVDVENPGLIDFTLFTLGAEYSF